MSPKLNSSKLIAVRSDLTTIAIRYRGKNMKHDAHRIYNVTRMFQFSIALHAYLQKQPPKVFCKKTVLKKFEKLSRKHLCLSLFLINIVDVQLYKKQTSTQVLYCKICENFKNRTPLMLIVALCLLKKDEIGDEMMGFVKNRVSRKFISERFQKPSRASIFYKNYACLFLNSYLRRVNKDICTFWYFPVFLSLKLKRFLLLVWFFRCWFWAGRGRLDK